MVFKIATLIASLLDPVARFVAWICPGVSYAAVIVIKGGSGLDAWTDGKELNVKAGPLRLEVYRS